MDCGRRQLYTVLCNAYGVLKRGTKEKKEEAVSHKVKGGCASVTLGVLGT